MTSPHWDTAASDTPKHLATRAADPKKLMTSVLRMPQVKPTSALRASPLTPLMRRGATVFTMSTLKDRLKWALEHRGMSQAALAREIGMSEANISQIFTNRPTAELKATNCFRVARALRIEPEWLGTGIGPRTPEERAIDAAAANMSRECVEHLRLFVHASPTRRQAATTLLTPEAQDKQARKSR